MVVSLSSRVRSACGFAGDSAPTSRKRDVAFQNFRENVLSVLARRTGLTPIVALVVCLCLLPAAAWGMRQGRADLARYENEGEALLDRWQVDDALAWAAERLADEPKQPGWLYLRARALFYQGRYQEALDAFDALLNVLPHPSFQAFRDFVAATQRSTADLQLLETAHFRIYLDPHRDAALMPYVADVLERSYQSLGGYFQFFPNEKIRVEIFPTASAFYPASSLSARDIEVSGAPSAYASSTRSCCCRRATWRGGTAGRTP